MNTTYSTAIIRIRTSNMTTGMRQNAMTQTIPSLVRKEKQSRTSRC